MSRKIIASICIFFFHFMSFGQIRLSGKVIDDSSSKKLPYATINITNANIGTVTNMEGVFNFFVQDTSNQKTFLVSHIGYNVKEIIIKNFKKGSTIFLEPKSMKIDTVTIASHTDKYIIGLLNNVLIKIRKNISLSSSKCFLRLTSVDKKSLPLELIEAFYQSKQNNIEGITDLNLKNGRIGILNENKYKFLSLNTLDVLQTFSPFQKYPEQKLPLSALNMKRKDQKKIYSFRLKNVNYLDDTLLKIEFSRKQNNDNFINGHILFSKSSLNVYEIYLHTPFHSKEIFLPIHPNDKIDSLKISMKLNLKPFSEKSMVLSYLNLNYSFQYYSATRKESMDIKTDATMVFYDYENRFYIPKFETFKKQNDYEKILTYGFDSLFWESNYPFVKTENEKEYEKFFMEYGTLLNYNKTGVSLNSDVFENKMIDWSSENLLWDDIRTESMEYQINESMNINYQDREFLKDLYNIDAKILLDIFHLPNETLSYHTKTLLDKQNTYYLLKKEPLTLEYISFYFDLHEIARIKMVLEIENLKFKTVEKIENIYKTEALLLDQILTEYELETKRGKDVNSMIKWNDKINQKLNITHHLLFEPKPTYKKNTEQPNSVNYYNIGTALLKIGKYEKAVIMFSKSINLLQRIEEYNNVFLFALYNRGLALYNNNLKVKACEDWGRSAKYGDELSLKMLNKYCKDIQCTPSPSINN